MARMPGATWRPIDKNFTYGGCRPRFVILHIIVGTLEGADSWFRNSNSRVSAHFGTGRDGELLQWVDTSSKAWANAGANGVAISVENEGQVGDALTGVQIERCAEVLAWAHEEHGVALAVTNDPNGSGLAFHNLCRDWSLSGTACPGPRIVAQREQIVERAKQIINGEDDNDMPGHRRFEKTKPQELQPGIWRSLKFDARHDGPGEFYSLVGPDEKDGAIYDLSVGVTLDGLEPGDEVQLRATEYEPDDNGGWQIARNRPIDSPVHAKANGHFTYHWKGNLGAGRRVRIRIAQFGRESATITDATSDVLYWPK
ncbi:N-acetylmuramoyl-L-alanine amidase [Nocardiopsis synnemataformans]|uniref:N-acetylmuramoyl-L-alanine amidase n=1 Tax=Nocardiopsis synnemataformans TaxID=61305 RepID=UPI003EBB4FD5